MKRYSILSFIMNNYESVKEVEDKDPDAEYILVTDDPSLSSTTWDVVYDDTLQGSPFDKCLYVRYHPFKYVHTNICIRLDGSIQILHSLKPIIDLFEKDQYDISLLPHPFNDNFLDEYHSWIEWRGYNQDQANKCLEDFKDKGYDFNHKGLFQINYSIVRNDDINNQLNEDVYNYISNVGENGHLERIDQIQFSYIMNTKYSHLKVLPVSEQILRSYYMQLCWHGSDNYYNLDMHYDYSHDDIRYMFNKPVTCLYLDTPVDCVHSREQQLQSLIKEHQDKEIEYKTNNKDLNKLLLQSSNNHKATLDQYKVTLEEYNKTRDAYLELESKYNALRNTWYNRLFSKFKR